MARLDTSDLFQHDELRNGNHSQLLTAGSYRVHDGGVEFRAEHEVELYTELNLRVEDSASGKEVYFNGVVVGCTGNKHQGYHISLAFMDIKQSDLLSLYEMYWAQM